MGREDRASVSLVRSQECVSFVGVNASSGARSLDRVQRKPARAREWKGANEGGQRGLTQSQQDTDTIDHSWSNAHRQVELHRTVRTRARDGQSKWDLDLPRTTRRAGREGGSRTLIFLDDSTEMRGSARLGTAQGTMAVVHSPSSTPHTRCRDSTRDGIVVVSPRHADGYRHALE